MQHSRLSIIRAALALLCLAVTSTPTANAYYYGGGGYYRGGYGGYYHGGYWGGNGGWYGTGIPNGLGWTMFGLGAAGAAAAIAAPYVAPPVYAAPAPVVYTAPGYYQPAPEAAVIQEVPASASAAPPNDMLSKAQAKLAGLGYFKGSVDGYYGPQTARAVEQFQTDNNLPVNGRLDLKTLSCLGISL